MLWTKWAPSGSGLNAEFKCSGLNECIQRALQRLILHRVERRGYKESDEVGEPASAQ